MDKSLGNQIKAARKKKNITQKQLASLIGKTTSSVQKYENGETEPPLGVVRAIADALDIDLASLIQLEAATVQLPIAIPNGGQIQRDLLTVKIRESEEQLNNNGISMLASYAVDLTKIDEYRR